MDQSSKRYQPAVTVIILFGIISLFGDMVYESARSANGQYLNLLSFSAAQVGLVYGIGEFIGYFLRLIAGVLSDRSGHHWRYIFLGYGLLAVVPLIGLSRQWPVLVTLILMERIGKALRSPAKDTVVSGVAEHQVGLGWAFGLQEALDQVGALSGPLIFTAVFYLSGRQTLTQYQLGYQLLAIPFGILMLVLVLAYRKIKREGLLPAVAPRGYTRERLSRLFWYYLAFVFFTSLGLVNFSLIGYHLKAHQLLNDGQITLLYAAAMGADAVAALAVGKGYDWLKDKTGLKTGGILSLMFIPLLTALLPLLTLTKSVGLIIGGMMIFGVVMGGHETIIRSAIADITPFHKRGTGYGVFHAGYGVALLIGASLMGLLYDKDLIGLIAGFSLIAQVIAGVIFYMMYRRLKQPAE